MLNENSECKQTYPEEDGAKEDPWAESSVCRFVINSIAWLLYWLCCGGVCRCLAQSGGRVDNMHVGHGDSAHCAGCLC
jgi:hypothetical protein